MAESRQALAARIRALVTKYFAQPAPRSDGPRLPLHVPSYGADEVNEAIEALLSTRITMGERVRRFETLWAEYLGVRHAVMVNSGSSANLVAAAVLMNPAFPGRPLPDAARPRLDARRRQQAGRAEPRHRRPLPVREPRLQLPGDRGAGGLRHPPGAEARALHPHPPRQRRGLERAPAQVRPVAAGVP